MQIGAVLPVGELRLAGTDVAAYVGGLEALGVDYVCMPEHVLGASIAHRPGWQGRYTIDDAFHEPFVMFGYMAAITTRLGFATSVMVLPQRQTALVAKQAAELALLSGDRFRLGVGIGWNEVEYEALSVPWPRRGARLEEQIAVLRRLWTEEVVDVAGEFHTIAEAGINPLPTKLVPVWVGGGGDSDRALDRIARLADGWLMPPDVRGELVCGADGPAAAASPIRELRARAEAAGRRPEDIGIEARLLLRELGEDRGAWRSVIEGWAAADISHLSIMTLSMGGARVADHLELVEEIMSLTRQLR